MTFKRVNGPRQCEACSRVELGLRLGLCRACYMRARRGSPAVGGECFACRIDDGRVLRSVRLATGEAIAACHNHGWLVERARPQPQTITEALSVAATLDEAQRIPGDFEAA
jgi:hypothetical protein